ncbi:MAG: prenyltransferase/squalene oxidase repeat-containing protein [Thermoleophilaceae bacterium]
MTWQVASYALLACALLAGFAWYERERPPARVVGVVAVLAALAVVGRLAFAAVPNVKPTTDIVLFAGYALGAAPGFAVGAIGAVASNVFLGHGTWTAWQMAAWGGVGIGGALLARAVGRRELGRWSLALACGVAGLAFGALMDVYQWTLAARQDLPTYLAIAATSLPYNLAHAFGNVGFCLLIGPVFVRSLRRYRRRFEVRWPGGDAGVAQRAGGTSGTPPPGGRAVGGAVAAAVAALALAVALTVPGAGAVAATGEPAEPAPKAEPAASADAAASSAGRAVRYLRRAQNRDGGFGGSPRQSSSQLVTGWSAIGLAAAGVSPRHVRRVGGRTVVAYMRRNTRRLGDVGELQRTMIALRASGVSARRFAGRSLLGRLRRAQGADGSWESNVAFTAFGVLALRAAGERPRAPRVRRAADYLEEAQADGGGWGFVPAATPDVDDTGAALQALAAAGRRRSAAVRDGADYLRATQAADGGWGQLEGRDSNAQSTAWAVQGLVAARTPLGSLDADPLRYLRGLQRRDGHFSYSRASDQTPVWVTAQALAAIRRKALPLAPPKRRRKAAAAVTSAAESTGAAGGGDRRGSGGDGPAGALLAAGAAIAVALAGAVGWRLRHGAADPIR